MNLLFSPQAWDDYLYWQKPDKKVVKKINELIQASSRLPYEGIGKPEPLRHAFTGFWSRRISPEHRMVYRIVGSTPEIVQLRYHYD